MLFIYFFFEIASKHKTSLRVLCKNYQSFIQFFLQDGENNFDWSLFILQDVKK